MQVELKELLLCIMIVAITVFVIYLIVAMKNLIQTLKEANKVLEDTEKVSGIVSKKVETSEEIIDNFIDALGTFGKAVKGKEGVVASMTSLAKAGATLVGMFKKDDEKDEKKDDKKGLLKRK